MARVVCVVAVSRACVCVCVEGWWNRERERCVCVEHQKKHPHSHLRGVVDDERHRDEALAGEEAHQALALVRADGEHAEQVEARAVKVQEEVLQVHARVHVPLERKLVVHRRRRRHGDGAEHAHDGRHDGGRRQRLDVAAARLQLVDRDACTCARV